MSKNLLDSYTNEELLLQHILNKLSESSSTTSDNTNYAAAAITSSVTVAEQNRSRSLVSIFNDTDVDGYVLLGEGTASPTSFTSKVAMGKLYETPAGWTGSVQFVAPSATSGNVGISELA